MLSRARHACTTTLTVFTFLITTGSLFGQLGVALQPSLPSPAPVGSLVQWTATPSGQSDYWYRFVVRSFGQPDRVAKDFGPESWFYWSPVDHEGFYVIEVTIRDLRTGELAFAAQPFIALSNAMSVPVVNATSHPLVFLYSAPPCPAGAVMTVYFLGPDNVLQNAPPQTCSSVFSMNTYIAGLKAQTSYYIKHIIEDRGRFIEGPVMTFVTGAVPDDLPTHQAVSDPVAGSTQNVHLSGSLFTRFVATDLRGDLIWYYPEALLFLTHPERGGYFFGVHEDHTGDQSRQILRLFDVAGVPILETNAARVSEQLVAMGKRPIGAFHHEARFLSDGNIVTIASVEQLLTDVQGEGTVNVVGDMVIVLNRDLEVVFAWDAFDHLDVQRIATQGEVCDVQACPPLFLGAGGNDWIHGNAVTETKDGKLLFSSRSQDWIIAIDYRGGRGAGDIVWKLGKDGDFRINSSDPNPWFSKQHDAEMEVDGTVTLFDNGNLRFADDPSARSRGQVLRLDERNRVAELVLNADLGYYAFALGSAQRLSNGNYVWDAGFLMDGTGITVETDAAGQTVYAIRGSAPEYRTFRMRSIYTLE